VQKLILAEGQASKIHVFVQLFTKSLPEKKMLDSLCRFLVELLASNGEIMFFKSVNGKSQIKILIAKGADINAKDNSGKTPLAIAIEKNHKEIISLLKKHGAVE